MSQQNSLVRLESKLPSDEVPDEDFASSTFFVGTGLELNARDFIGPPFDDLDSSPGELWSFAEPRDGTFAFELATELPYYLPEMGSAEQVLEVNDDQLFFCNRMVQAFYGAGYPNADGLDYLLMHRFGLSQVAEQVGPLHPIPLSTFVSCKFACEAESAQAALEDNLFSWIQKFIQDINRVVEAYRQADPVNSRYMDYLQSINSFSHFWLALLGDQPDCVQVSPNLRGTTFTPVNYVSEDGERIVKSALSGGDRPPAFHKILSDAYNYAHYGSLKLAVVHISIACESALSMHLTEHYKNCGVSNSKLGEYFEGQTTYSEMLNVHLFSMCDMTNFSGHQETIGNINWARRKRNSVVHEGETEEDLSRDDVEDALESATDLINFLAQQC